MTDAFPITAGTSEQLKKQLNKRRNKNPKGGGKGFGSGAGFGKAKKSPLIIPHEKDRDEEIPILKNFLDKLGAEGILEGTHVGLDSQTKIRGLYATQSFQKGDIICRIPSSCAMALSDPDLLGQDVPTLAHEGHNFFKIYVENPSARSMWAPYLNLLPTRDYQFHPTPDYFSPEELELLEFPRLIRMAEKRKRQIAEVAAASEMNVNELQFSTWLVASRSCEIPIDEQKEDDLFQDEEENSVVTKTQIKSIRLMLPYLDFCNHCTDNPNVGIHVIDPGEDDAWFSLIAKRPILEGEQLFLCYGNGVDSSVEILMNQGIVESSNKIDALMLKKGGKGCLSSPSDWTTTLQEDELMLKEAEEGSILKTILSFRVRLKKAYKDK